MGQWAPPFFLAPQDANLSLFPETLPSLVGPTVGEWVSTPTQEKSEKIEKERKSEGEEEGEERTSQI